MATAKTPVDLSKVSDAELKAIHNDVLKKMTERAIKPGGGVGPVADYDRHSSGHSRSGGGITSGLDRVSTPAIKANPAIKNR